jgi:endonuclease-3 related protein
VDAYTRRILDRHAILSDKTPYEQIRELFQAALSPLAEAPQHKIAVPPQLSGTRGAAHPPSPMSTAKRTALVQIYNQMHGLIVGVGKNHCGKSHPKCDECPLHSFLPSAQ